MGFYISNGFFFAMGGLRIDTNCPPPENRHPLCWSSPIKTPLYKNGAYEWASIKLLATQIFE